MNMEYVLTFSSTHLTMSAEQRLLAGGIAVRVMPLPSSLGVGCGFCLRFGMDSLATAKELLAGVPVRGLYRMQRQNGKAVFELCPF